MQLSLLKFSSGLYIRGNFMRLNIEQIKDILLGAVRVEEEDGLIKLYRFTKEQQELYKETNDVFYMKSFSSAGMKIKFETDSENLYLNVITAQGSSRQYFSYDVYVDGKPLGNIDNFSETELPEKYTLAELSHGEFSGEFSLGKGIKNVCIYLPWSASTAIKELSIDDGAFIKTKKPCKKLLVFGDSITQGYDALRPSSRYMTRLSDKIGAEEFNKAIGGERFSPPLAELKEAFTPDYVLVAYGTNDWCVVDRETFIFTCRGFFEALTKNYPTQKIFAITPIWRKDYKEEREFGPFEDVAKAIGEIVSDYDNVIPINGFDFVPHDEMLYADRVLHPNDEGFKYYFENLYNAIKDKL